MAKRFYWLKMQEGFFRQKEIKKLRHHAGGDTYTIIYLKMLLRSLENGGKLYYEGFDSSFPDELALDIDESVENVRVTCQFLFDFGILVQHSDVEFELLTASEMVGSETDSAKRVREHRARKSLQCDAPALLCNGSVTECYTEIDIDRELDKRLRDNNSLCPNSADAEPDAHKMDTKCIHGVSVPYPGARVDICPPISGADICPPEYADIRPPENRDKENINISRSNSEPEPPDTSKPKKAKRVYAHDETPYKAAAWLAKRKSENFPNLKPPSETELQNWADCFRLLHERDGYGWKTISDVLAWCQDDDFWKRNILSGGKFRKQFDQLLVKSGVGVNE